MWRRHPPWRIWQRVKPERQKGDPTIRTHAASLTSVCLTRTTDETRPHQSLRLRQEPVDAYVQPTPSPRSSLTLHDPDWLHSCSYTVETDEYTHLFTYSNIISGDATFKDFLESFCKHSMTALQTGNVPFQSKGCAFLPKTTRVSAASVSASVFESTLRISSTEM